jgi:hypothetical protein
VYRKKPSLWPNDWILHRENAPADKALCVKQFFGLKIDHWNGTPTLLPVFGSEWFLAVSKNNVCLNGTKISGYWGIKRCDVMESYSTTGVPKKCFQQWQHCWAKCIATQGKYLEGGLCKYASMLCSKIIPGTS